MRRNRGPFEFKTLLLSTAAATILMIPAAAQERMPSGSQDRPAATQSQSPGASQPSAQQDRRQRVQDRSEKGGTTGQGSPRQSTDAPADASMPDATQDREGRSPSQPKAQQKQRSQSETERDRGNQQMQSRDTERMRDKQRTQSREYDRTQQRNQRAAPDRQRRQDDARSPRDRAGEKAARDNARTGDSNRQAAQPTEQQRTRISTSIRQSNVQPVRNVNFSVSVGAVIPASVRAYPVTPAILEVYPQYRGYSFVLVEDEIVIIEPRTKRIVTVIDQGGRGGRSASVSRSRLSLTEKQRDVIRRSATERRTTGSGAVTTIDREIVVGDELPDTIEIESFPDTVYTEVPEIRSYRYIVRDDDVYLVDPAERRVIEVIR